MARMIDQIRASKLPSNMMQFAARGALQVPAAENIEILVYLAKYNKVFGELARMTLAGWDEKACLAAVADPQTPAEVLNYFISSDNLRPKLLPALLENPSIREEQIAKVSEFGTSRRHRDYAEEPAREVFERLLLRLSSRTLLSSEKKPRTGQLRGSHVASCRACC